MIFSGSSIFSVLDFEWRKSFILWWISECQISQVVNLRNLENQAARTAPSRVLHRVWNVRVPQVWNDKVNTNSIQHQTNTLRPCRSRHAQVVHVSSEWSAPFLSCFVETDYHVFIDGCNTCSRFFFSHVLFVLKYKSTVLVLREIILAYLFKVTFYSLVFCCFEYIPDTVRCLYWFPFSFLSPQLSV